jgi:dihydropyrimidinase
MDYLIKNGRIADKNGCYDADLIIKNGKITYIGDGLDASGLEVIDASGCYVMPGFIDTHTHFDLNTGSCITADDFNTGTRAAIMGGTTTVLDFATQDRDGTLNEALNVWREKAKTAHCNYGFHMAIARWDKETEAEMADMTREGITSYKMYMVYDSLRVDDGSLYAALKAAKQYGAIIVVHCENWDTLLRITQEVKDRGILGPEGHPLSRPNDIEAEAVARYMRLAKLADAPAYVVHLSTHEGLEEALRARKRGQEVYLETCPQYLFLDDEHYLDPDGAKFVMSPPLRKKEDNKALITACARGEIDTLGTDHCSFTMAQKLAAADFSGIPNGGAGVRWRGELLYTYGVLAGRMTMQRFSALMSGNAASIFGLAGRGRIAKDFAADVVIWDGAVSRTISDTDGEHNCDNTPFNGMEVKGCAKHVFLNGELVVKDGKLIAENRGRYIRRKAHGKIR